jgi:hypothetical protein
MNKLLLVVIALGLVVSTSSCTLWRRVTHRRPGPVTKDSTVVVIPDTTILVRPDTVAIVVPAPPVDSGQQALIAALLPLWTTHKQFNTFSGKAKVNYEGKGEKKDFTANIRIQKDKKIWISIVALGVYEAVRVLITPDTIIVLNRIDKEAQILPFSDAGKLLPVNVDFQSLQSLLIGDVLNAGAMPSGAADTSNELRLSITAPEYTQSITYNKPDSLLRSQLLSTASSTMVALYSDYEVINNRHFSKSRVMDMTDKGEAHHIDMEFNKVSFDEEVNMDFSIPSKYTRK